MQKAETKTDVCEAYPDGLLDGGVLVQRADELRLVRVVVHNFGQGRDGQIATCGVVRWLSPDVIALLVHLASRRRESAPTGWMQYCTALQRTAG